MPKVKNRYDQYKDDIKIMDDKGNVIMLDGYLDHAVYYFMHHKCKKDTTKSETKSIICQYVYKGYLVKGPKQRQIIKDILDIKLAPYFLRKLLLQPQAKEN